MRQFNKNFLFVFLLFSLLLTQTANAETIVQNIQSSTLIVIANVEKIEKWKGRADFQIITLKPIQALKGSFSSSPLKLLDQRLFSNAPQLFQPSKKVLVFLKPLPAYTAWQEMIKQGVQFELAGKSHAFFDSAEDQKNLSAFVFDFLKLSNLSERKDFYLRTLEQTASKILQEDLVEDFFALQKNSLTLQDLTTLSKLVLTSQASNETKIKITKQISQMKTAETNATLKSFFCISPEPVCLIAAEVLESQKLPISVADYSKALEKASDSLKVGLLQILGRHQRQEAYPLFENTLAKENSPQNSASIIEALSEMGGPEAETLCLKYAKDPRYFVRLAVVRSLGKLKSVKGIPDLEIALKSGDPSMINLGAKSLEQIGTPEALKTLQKYFEKTPHGYLEPVGPEHFNLPK